MSGFSLATDTLLRLCGAATIVTGQSSVKVNGLLAAVLGDMDTHPGVPANVMTALMGLGGASPISALSALSGFTGLPTGVLGGLSFGNALSGLSSLQGVGGFASMMNGMGVNLGTFTGAMSSLGVPVANMANIEGGAGSISAAISSISGASLGSLASGGLSNIASLSGIGSIAGIGSVQNYLNAAQGILGAGGSLGNLANAMGAISGMSGGPGALMSILNANVFAEGKPMIAAIVDMAQTDIMGIIPHITGLPIPVMGSPNVRMGSGSGAAGIGMMQALGLGNFGALSIGELVSVAGQVVGMVSNFTQLGGGSAVAQLSNMQGSPLSSGATVTGQTSGYTFTFANYFDSRVATGDYAYPDIATISNALVQDDGQYITIDDYQTFYPSLNLSASVITV